MKVPARISIISLGVSDLERSVAFYEALGWTNSQASNEEIAWFLTADSVLGLYQRDKLAADANLSHEPVAPFGGVTLAINVEDDATVDAVMAAALTAGATSLKEPQRVEWGGYSGYFADPDAHPWEVAHNPFIGFTDSGSLDMA